MQLIEVDSEKTRTEFLQVPRIIYRNDPNWISHLDQDIEKVFDPTKNKYYELGEAIRWVLTDDQNNLIGRIAAFVHPEFSTIFNQPTGGIGFFECINNKEAAFYLFDACKEWLLNKGMEAMDGPINFGEKDRFWGLLVEGFENPPLYSLNYNPPYYQEFFEAYGFGNFYNQHVYYLRAEKEMPQILKTKYERLVLSQGFRFDHLKLKNLEKYASDFMTIYNEAWSSTHRFFKPLSKEAAIQTFKSMKKIFDERLVIFAYHQEKPVAFFISIPELNGIFRYLNGKLNLAGKLKFIFYRWLGKLNQICGLVFGIIPNYRNKGLDAGLIMTLKNYVSEDNHYQGAYIAWIGDFNRKMIRIVEHIGSEKVFTLTTYRYLFNRSAPFERHPVLD
ncbi:MAG TPA: hypothetical protein VLH61_10665 [Bacteroidales bacterium]|nr:hypothetical protein [Bacteroidales bacterium]